MATTILIPYPETIPEDRGGKPTIPLHLTLEVLNRIDGGKYRRMIDALVGDGVLEARFEQPAPITTLVEEQSVIIERNGFSCAVMLDKNLQRAWDTSLKNIELFTLALNLAGLSEAARTCHDVVTLVIHKLHGFSPIPTMHDFLKELSQACNCFCEDLAIALAKHLRTLPNVNTAECMKLEDTHADLLRTIGQPTTEWRMQTWNPLIQAFVDEIRKYSPATPANGGRISGTEILVE